VAWGPLQPPEAVQAVALVLDQVSVLELPLWMLLGLALKVTVRAGGVGGGAVPAQVSRTAASSLSDAWKKLLSDRVQVYHQTVSASACSHCQVLAANPSVLVVLPSVAVLGGATFTE
jgi:hypothetical protein